MITIWHSSCVQDEPDQHLPQHVHPRGGGPHTGTLSHQASAEITSSQVFASLGHWATAVYAILALPLVPVWVVGTLAMFRSNILCFSLRHK